MNRKRLATDRACGVVWQQVLAGMFSVTERLVYLSSCRDPLRYIYRHDKLAKKLGTAATSRAIRCAHSRVWEDWLGGSLEQQCADLFFYLKAMPASMSECISFWRDTKPFDAFAPEAATNHEREMFRRNILVVLALLSTWYPACPSEERGSSVGACKSVDYALQLIKKNYGSSTFSLQSLSKAVGVSVRHLGRLIQSHTGFTFRQYLRRLRIAEAEKLLAVSDKEVKVIAGMVGYNYSSHFIAQFRQTNGSTPHEFKKQAGKLACNLGSSAFVDRRQPFFLSR